MKLKNVFTELFKEDTAKTGRTGRIEVWFKSGLFRAFPDVELDSVIREGGETQFIFSGGHAACIQDENVNFMETMYNEN